MDRNNIDEQMDEYFGENSDNSPQFFDINDPDIDLSLLIAESEIQEDPGPPQSPSVCPTDGDRVDVSNHSYLGYMNDVRGRVIFGLEDSRYCTIPIFNTPPVKLAPGQIFPYVDHDRRSHYVIKYAMEHKHIFGMLQVNRWRENMGLGITAEIVEHGTEGDDVSKIKAIGRDRFKVKQYKSINFEEHTIELAEVELLQDVEVEPAMTGIQLPSLNKIRKANPAKCLKLESSLTAFPDWIWRGYQENYLVKEIKTRIGAYAKGVNLMNDPSALAFQTLKVVPVNGTVVAEFLKLNSTIQRLRMANHTIEAVGVNLMCARCSSAVGSYSEMMQVSTEGPHGTFCNPSGYIHEIITLRNMWGARLSGQPQSEYSWYPGYLWTACICQYCRTHIGWKFTATSLNKVPQFFWGIRSSAVHITRDSTSTSTHDSALTSLP